MELTAMSLTIQLGDAHVDAAQLADLCQRFGVTELALFGSAVRGQMRPDSDIDVMVESILRPALGSSSSSRWLKASRLWSGAKSTW